MKQQAMHISGYRPTDFLVPFVVVAALGSITISAVRLQAEPDKPAVTVAPVKPADKNFADRTLENMLRLEPRS